jgi:selenocysteine lyase/cysteine desulfurase
MVRLPSALDLSMDAPGEPSKGVRATLRERYGIEAAVGGFGAHGGFLRLSHAVYTTDEDIRRLRDAVSEMAAAAARHKGT